ncbi:hypothetical protein LXA43DRAFT_608686 [Ganoderma leucocontextum]|nr:hypothetical protein LXA43DRAFT_608686 [Ganoderma leucocontextum]
MYSAPAPAPSESSSGPSTEASRPLTMTPPSSSPSKSSPSPTKALPLPHPPRLPRSPCTSAPRCSRMSSPSARRLRRRTCVAVVTSDSTFKNGRFEYLLRETFLRVGIFDAVCDVHRAGTYHRDLQGMASCSARTRRRCSWAIPGSRIGASAIASSDLAGARAYMPPGQSFPLIQLPIPCRLAVPHRSWARPQQRCSIDIQNSTHPRAPPRGTSVPSAPSCSTRLAAPSRGRARPRFEPVHVRGC